MATAGMILSDFKGEQLIKLVHSSVDKKMEAVGILLVNELKQELVQRDNLSGDNASAPGQPPAKVTGTLSRSITYIYDKAKQALRVGTPVIYGKWLEMGHRSRGQTDVAPRPWLRPVFRKNKTMIERIFKGK